MHKILYITSTLEQTGPVNQLFNILTNLDTKLYYPLILTLSPEKENSKKSDFINKGVEVHSLNINRLAGLIKLRKKLIKFLKNNKSNIIHTQGYRADILVSKLNLNINVVRTIRTNPNLDYHNRYGVILGNYMRNRHLGAIKKNNNSIACSKSLAEQLSVLVDKKIEYIQNAVNSELFKNVSQNRKIELRKTLNLGLDRKIFMFAGPLDKGKNIISLIKAFKQNNTGKRTELLIIGDSSKRDELIKIAADTENIKFLGKKSNILDYYKSADFYISASKYEGLPNSVLEAMSCGLPVILSDIGAHKEIFDTSPSYPYFFAVDNTENLTELIEKIVSTNYRILSQQMREIIENSFSASNNAEKYMKFYERMLK